MRRAVRPRGGQQLRLDLLERRRCMLGEDRAHAIEAEFLVVAVEDLGQPVGEDEKGVAGRRIRSRGGAFAGGANSHFRENVKFPAASVAWASSGFRK